MNKCISFDIEILQSFLTAYGHFLLPSYFSNVFQMCEDAK